MYCIIYLTPDYTLGAITGPWSEEECEQRMTDTDDGRAVSCLWADRDEVADSLIKE